MAQLLKHDGSPLAQEVSLIEFFTSPHTSYFRGVEITDTGKRPTPLRALRHPARSPYEAFISDSGLNVVCYIRPDRKIDGLPYHDSDGNPHEHFYYDYAKTLSQDTFTFDGTLRDALLEFQQKGYELNIGRWPILFSFDEQTPDRKNPDTIWSPRRNYVVIKTDVTIDEILAPRQKY